MLTAFVIILSYLLGSIPTAYIVGRLASGVDIRKLGDGNAGAANVYREIGQRAGIFVLFADVAKGVAALLLAKYFSVSEPFLLLCGAAAIAGHNWPLPIGFKGGRGVSTAIGVLLVLLPPEMAIMIGFAVVALFVTRNVNVTCGIMFAPLPLVTWIFGASVGLIAYSAGIPSFVGFTHFLTMRHQPQKSGEAMAAADNHNGE